MYRLITFVLLLVLLAPACSSENRPNALTEQFIREQLLGTWCMKYVDGSACQSHESFSSDGLLRACMRSDDRRVLIRVVATYAVDKNRICFRVTGSTEQLLPVGDQFCVTVLHLDRNTYRYILDGESKADEMRRLPASTAVCPNGDA